MNLLSLLPTKYLIIIAILLAASAIGYHYYTIHSLNSTISDQKTQIEKLEKEASRLENKIEKLENSVKQFELVDEIKTTSYNDEIEKLKNLLKNCSKPKVITKKIEVPCEENKLYINIEKLDDNSSDSLKILNKIGF